MTRQEIIDHARTYVAAKTRWRHMGRTARGCDCIGFICLIGDHFGIPYQDMLGYSRQPDGRFVDHVKKHLIWRDPQVIATGSVVIFRESAQPCHIGVIGERYGQPSLIHASAAKKYVVEEEYDRWWSDKFTCVLDFPGVED